MGPLRSSWATGPSAQVLVWLGQPTFCSRVSVAVTAYHIVARLPGAGVSLARLAVVAFVTTGCTATLVGRPVKPGVEDYALPAAALRRELAPYRFLDILHLGDGLTVATRSAVNQRRCIRRRKGGR